MSLDAHTRVRLLVIGVGGRGARAYGAWCLANPDDAGVVAIADPNDERRKRVGDRHDIDSSMRFTDWRDALAQPGSAWDAVVVATPDRLHVEPAVRAMELGYDVLLEKPIAPTEEGLARVEDASRTYDSTVTVAHVLRYTPFFTTLRDVIRGGDIGELQGIEHTENIGFWHFAHSFVRGNWHDSQRSSPMILAKSCHDIDVLRFLVDAPYTAVSSFGRLRHFRPELAPAGSTERCIDGCAVADSCPYNAERFYVEQLAGAETFAVAAMTSDTSPEGRRRALAETNYGRCVYRMDNDVVDHQTTTLEFANGVTASLVVSAFTADVTRTLTVMGSHGQIHANMLTGEIETIRFRDVMPTTQNARPERARGITQTVGFDDDGTYSGHGGGDEGLMTDFTYRVRQRLAGEPVDDAPSSLAESLESHHVAFAAERSRLSGTVQRLA